jgi:hypothetical protein
MNLFLHPQSLLGCPLTFQSRRQRSLFVTTPTTAIKTDKSAATPLKKLTPHHTVETPLSRTSAFWRHKLPPTPKSKTQIVRASSGSFNH